MNFITNPYSTPPPGYSYTFMTPGNYLSQRPQVFNTEDERYCNYVLTPTMVNRTEMINVTETSQPQFTNGDWLEKGDNRLSPSNMNDSEHLQNSNSGNTISNLLDDCVSPTTMLVNSQLTGFHITPADDNLDESITNIKEKYIAQKVVDDDYDTQAADRNSIKEYALNQSTQGYSLATDNKNTLEDNEMDSADNYENEYLQYLKHIESNKSSTETAYNTDDLHSYQPCQLLDSALENHTL